VSGDKGLGLLFIGKADAWREAERKGPKTGQGRELGGTISIHTINSLRGFRSVYS
jgi:hypothetical protein